MHTHEDPPLLTRQGEEDMGRPLIQLVMPSNRVGSRAAPGSLSAKDFNLAIDGTPTWRDEDRTLRVADFVLARTGDTLEVVSRDGNRRFHIGEIIRLIFGFVVMRFSMCRSTEHRPRLTIDNLVISRERWSAMCREVPFAWEKTRSERFVEARRWKRKKGMPRRVFFSVDTELKPVYLDFDSPLSVDIAAKMIRLCEKQSESSGVSFSEMLPSPEQCWLIDHEGNRYTGELRIAAVDPIQWTPENAAKPNLPTSQPSSVSPAS